MIIILVLEMRKLTRNQRRGLETKTPAVSTPPMPLQPGPPKGEFNGLSRADSSIPRTADM